MDEGIANVLTGAHFPQSTIVSKEDPIVAPINGAASNIEKILKENGIRWAIN